jgi:putative thioredoxin
MDVTDATFEAEVLDTSAETPVVVDLWATWCPPCRALGPVIEKVVDETNGAVRLAKVNVDENPRVAASFGVSSIPAVFAIYKRQIVDHFIGALPEADVRAFVERVVPVKTEADQLVEKGDEESLRAALALEPDHTSAVLGLAALLTERGDGAEALTLLSRLPETPDVRKAAARARLTQAHSDGSPSGAADGPIALGVASGTEAGSLDERLDALLERAGEDEAARQELLDVLETMDDDDLRRARYRKALAARLF